jgi:ABC-type nickel/cobalt efflux system permease component RcnA
VVSLRQLWALGITGGIVPCPAALVVLLSALSLRRVGFGLLLIVAFSLGLALVLIAIGMLMVYARRLVARFDERGPLVTRWLPLASSAVMVLLGVSIALQAVASGVMPWKLT